MDEDRETLDFRLADKWLSSPSFTSPYVLDMRLVRAIEWLQELLAKIPAEHRDGAYFRVECTRDYEGGHDSELQIGYEREITDAEIAERERKEARESAQYEAERQARDRAEFERLKAKFADNEKEQ